MSTLCDPADCTLLIIDPQVRLMPAIHDAETVIRRCLQLATAARELVAQGIVVADAERVDAGCQLRRIGDAFDALAIDPDARLVAAQRLAIVGGIHRHALSPANGFAGNCRESLRRERRLAENRRVSGEGAIR